MIEAPLMGQSVSVKFFLKEKNFLPIIEAPLMRQSMSVKLFFLEKKQKTFLAHDRSAVDETALCAQLLPKLV